LENVRYRDILDIERLDIPSEKITCIVGESGSGKTTLLRLLNNMISCDRGNIFYRGQSIYTINPIELRRKVIMLAQNPVVFPGTIKDNLLIGLKFSEKPLVSDEKLKEVLEKVYLEKAIEDGSENLSGGEKQRLALARVMLTNPEVFLLDEPSSALDENTEELVIARIVQHVKQNNKTLVMITHTKKIAQMYGEKLIEMKKGRVSPLEGAIK